MEALPPFHPSSPPAKSTSSPAKKPSALKRVALHPLGCLRSSHPLEQPLKPPTRATPQATHKSNPSSHPQEQPLKPPTRATPQATHSSNPSSHPQEQPLKPPTRATPQATHKSNPSSHPQEQPLKPPQLCPHSLSPAEKAIRAEARHITPVGLPAQALVLAHVERAVAARTREAGGNPPALLSRVVRRLLRRHPLPVVQVAQRARAGSRGGEEGSPPETSGQG
ncbi:unnamed protein product [Closterium sp. Naga37s-1]|nr:unnamed protein product [Closterium sp. Naga37s-1]